MITFAAGDDMLDFVMSLGGCVFLITIVGVVVYAIIDLRRQLREHAAGNNLCRHCGYDLRGMAHERCPECGQATPLI